ncbi:7501_t:CDS:2 [Ambispora leptoticha]|uniref:7501_t:CDS:1 n=1 Tax=Ambispora leptoticha TaxID=144679 RepID=A0A9N8W214_9GLOM|nr:7501_t:CDS:2 [Ambispora leptoticha]
MPEVKINTAYPVIDTDPHFLRVVRYFRSSDYAVWTACTVGGPAFMLAFEKVSPTYQRLGVPLKIATLLGAMGGFLLAYQRSSLRFWGWTENEREYDLDMKEMKQRLKEGKSLYGESDLDLFNQASAARQSRYAALKFSWLPWFNFVNHPFHGVDPKKYEDEE